jgi:hypothetical protein
MDMKNRLDKLINIEASLKNSKFNATQGSQISLNQDSGSLDHRQSLGSKGFRIKKNVNLNQSMKASQNFEENKWMNRTAGINFPPVCNEFHEDDAVIITDVKKHIFEHPFDPNKTQGISLVNCNLVMKEHSKEPVKFEKLTTILESPAEKVEAKITKPVINLKTIRTPSADEEHKPK